MLTNHNWQDIYEKKVENGNWEREKMLLEKIWYLLNFLVIDISNSMSKITVFLVLLFCFSSVILKPFIFRFSFSEN